MDLKTDFHNQLAKNGVSPSPRADSFLDFIKSGSIKSGSSESEVRALLDFARSMVLDLSGKVRSLEKLNRDAMMAVRSAQAEINRRKASPTAAQARSAAPPAAPATVTAAEFSGPPPPRMLRSEFEKLTDSLRSKFIRDGGKLIGDPKPAR